MIYMYQALAFLIKKISEDCSSYGDESNQTLLQRDGKERPAQSVMGENL